MLTIDVSRTIMLIGLSEPLCFLAYYLAQQQVGQAACAQTEELVGEPFLAEYFFYDGVIATASITVLMPPAGLRPITIPVSL